jgi:hypothetical protein
MLYCRAIAALVDVFLFFSRPIVLRNAFEEHRAQQEVEKTIALFKVRWRLEYALLEIDCDVRRRKHLHDRIQRIHNAHCIWKSPTSTICATYWK